MLQGLHISPKARHTRPLSTLPPGPDDVASKDDFAAASEAALEAEAKAKVPGMISNLNAARKRVHQEQGPSGPMASDNTHDAVVAGNPAMVGFREMADGLRGNRSEGERIGQQFEHQPLVERPPWGHRPQQADNGQEANGGSDGSGENSAEVASEGEAGDEGPRVEIHARAIPVSPSYFSRQPEFNDAYLLLQKLMRRYAHLPTVSSDQLERVAFRTLKDYRLAAGEDVKASEYARCMTLVKRLNKIHPKLAPPNVKVAIAPFIRDINPHIHKAKEIPIDKFGRTLGVGKRKTSIARAWVVEGVGEVLVNGKSLADAFGRIHDRESAVWALKATARTDKYNVWALVEGGGTTGQAEALAMAVGKALMAHEPALKPALRRGEWLSFTNNFINLVLTSYLAGVVTRDPRGVERKKQGHLKARKKPAWVKR